MDQYAETNLITPSNYYDFFDPEHKLTEVKRIEKAEHEMDDLPGSFPKMLVHLMNMSHTTIDKLAENAHISAATVKRYRHSGNEQSYTLDYVVAICIAMHLPPCLSSVLLARAGLSLGGSRRNRQMAWILHTMYRESIEVVQARLDRSGQRRLNLLNF